MNVYKLKLMKKEFCFLVDIEVSVGSLLEELTDLKVKKGDKILLTKKGFEDSYVWSGGGHHDYTVYFAVFAGNKLFQFSSAGRHGNGSGANEEWDAPTLGEQILSNNLDPDYIVECVKNDSDDNGNGEVTRFWTVYKMKDFNLLSYHQSQIDRAAAELKAELAAACA